ncbi:MAG: TonB-dependent receptor [Acidobacteria bacterium]|nr:TonB-dependent receptor [Acidobacteriota bacterium]
MGQFRKDSMGGHSARLLILGLFLAAVAFGQDDGSVRGTVTLAGEGTPLHGVRLRLLRLNRTATTDEQGNYSFENVPAGTYSLTAQMEGFRDISVAVTVQPGATSQADAQLRLIGPTQEVTVTASGQEQVAFQSFQTVTVLDSTQLVGQAQPSIGEVMEHQPGVAKRSFGPGPSRPIIRGFDGDRVLVLEDSMPTGSIASQMTDGAEPIDVLTVETLEVVKGPATLLYGSNALGGVVNALTGRDRPGVGLRGYLTAIAGSANSQAGGSAGFQFGANNWTVWGNGGGQRTGDYDTPLGTIVNSRTRLANSAAGFGWFGPGAFFRLGYGYDNGRYGVPSPGEEEGDSGEPEATFDHFRRHNIPFRLGVQIPDGFFRDFQLSLNYSDWKQKEAEEGIVKATFDNRQFTYRGTFNQRHSEILSGTLGFEGRRRSYNAAGDEVLSPPVAQNAFAVYGLEELDLRAVRLQLGGRLETNGYTPQDLRRRRFTGFSGAAGIHAPLGRGTALVVNYNRSFRAPALVELYNHGPDFGNRTFEIGNPSLTRETGDGIELSLRHSSSRLQAEGSLYYYSLYNFVFLAPTAEVEDGLTIANYSQADSRFMGTEVTVSVGLHPDVWLNLGLDTVDAQLKLSKTPLPRIPPLRGRIGLEAQHKGFRLNPELILAGSQEELFPAETRTAGYAAFNINASYTVPQQHVLHIFSVTAFNLADRLYRNHLSFIKEIAPEIGRGVRFAYTMRFF